MQERPSQGRRSPRQARSGRCRARSAIDAKSHPLGNNRVDAASHRFVVGEPDIGATLELIDFLCAAGVQGIALLGSTGEFVNLNFDDRVRLVYLAVKRSRVPVLAGVSHSTLDGALALGREASAAGAAGL